MIQQKRYHSPQVFNGWFTSKMDVHVEKRDSRWILQVVRYSDTVILINCNTAPSACAEWVHDHAVRFAHRLRWCDHQSSSRPQIKSWANKTLGWHIADIPWNIGWLIGILDPCNGLLWTLYKCVVKPLYNPNKQVFFTAPLELTSVPMKDPLDGTGISSTYNYKIHECLMFMGKLLAGP